MKRVIFLIALLAGALLATSCELDNYDGPDASISGGIYDVQTGELIPQDIIQGSVIEYTEDGYGNPQFPEQACDQADRGQNRQEPQRKVPWQGSGYQQCMERGPAERIPPARPGEEQPDRVHDPADQRKEQIRDQ